jgi:hypothetical protein
MQSSLSFRAVDIVWHISSAASVMVFTALSSFSSSLMIAAAVLSIGSAGGSGCGAASAALGVA